MNDAPPVELSFERDWCAKHLEPFRAGWPAGAMLAMVSLFQAFAADDEVVRYCGGDVDRLAEGKRLGAAVREMGPMCCKVGPAVLAEIVEDALAGLLWRHHIGPNGPVSNAPESP